MSILDLNSQLASLTKGGTAAGNASQTSTERKPSEFWMNVGVNLPGSGKDGEDVFVSPFGIAMDRLKAETVRNGDSAYGHLIQVKNKILEMAQAEVAKLQPGQHVDVPLFTVRLYRKAEPADPTGDVTSNPLLAAFEQRLGG